MKKTSEDRIVLLGTGTPNAEPDRSGPALAVLVDGEAFLVDCGPGVVRKASAASRQGIDPLEPKRLNRLFVTHLHSDHTTGLPDLMLTPWVLGRREPLEIFGPPGIAAMAENIQAAYREDIDARRGGLEPANADGWRIDVREIAPGLVFESERLRVEAIPVDHGPWAAFGYRFRSPERTVVISGDTAPTESIVEMSRGCDVLVHEVYSTAGFEGLEPEWQRYHSKMHTSSRELARIAAQARPGLLVLYHQLFWGVSEDDLLAEVRREYDGAVVSGHDLEIH